MDKNTYNTFRLFYLPLFALSAQASADYKADIGFNWLQTELGASLPTGEGVKVTQVEASSVKDTDPRFPVFAPDPNVSTMDGKTFAYPGLSCATPPCLPDSFSSHALGVANVFYGNSVSMATDITNIHSYEANQWISSLYVHGPNDQILQATTTDRRIGNHSWVGSGATNQESGTILRIVDRQVNQNEYIQVAASGSALLGNAYNVVSVGVTNGNSSTSSDIDNTYIAGRAITDIVAPAANLSTATPIVSAVTALLVETGHKLGNELSKGSETISGVGSVFNAERSETIKAALMAGADRQTSNTSDYGNISDYGAAPHKTANGLDDRYGAGQVNVYNSYQIITGGEQNSLEDGGDNIGQISLSGFDYDPTFGGTNRSNLTASYSFTADADETLSAALVWNLDVSDDFELNTTIHHLELSLKDVTENKVIAISDSMVDNTQNIHFTGLIGGHDYQLRIASLETGTVNLDYSLAWHRTINTTPVPLPAAFWLFGSALVGVVGFQRKPLASA